MSERNITIHAKVRTQRTAARDAHSHPDHYAHRSLKTRTQKRLADQKLTRPVSRTRRVGIQKVQDDHLRPKGRRAVWGRRPCFVHAAAAPARGQKGGRGGCVRQ